VLSWAAELATLSSARPGITSTLREVHEPVVHSIVYTDAARKASAG